MNRETEVLIWGSQPAAAHTSPAEREVAKGPAGWANVLYQAWAARRTVVLAAAGAADAGQVRAMSATTEHQIPPRQAALEAGRPVLRGGAAVYWLSGLLAATAVVTCLLTFLVPGVLHGTAVMNGSGRGTALVMLLLGVPVLATSMWLARAGSARAVLSWLGAAAFVLYNSVMLLFATPFNRLFLLDVAMLALAAWSVGVLLWRTDVAALGRRFTSRAPARAVAVYVWVIVTLNTLAWLGRIVPALTSAGQAAFLRGTGLTTSPGYIQDLALWLPLIAVAAAWLWRRRAWGFLIIGATLVMWVLEGAAIAVDQWYGHAADPASAVASAAFTPVFGAVALAGLIPVYYLFRSLPDRTHRLWKPARSRKPNTPGA